MKQAILKPNGKERSTGVLGYERTHLESRESERDSFFFLITTRIRWLIGINPNIVSNHNDQNYSLNYINSFDRILSLLGIGDTSIDVCFTSRIREVVISDDVSAMAAFHIAVIVRHG